MKRLLVYFAPNILTLARLIAGPLYLALGHVPGGAIEVGVLTLAAATDLADGRLARALHTTSSLGGALDTTADKVFVVCVLLKLGMSSVVPMWLFWLIVAQYFLLAIAGTTYVRRYGKIPVPESWAHVSATLAVATSIVGVATGNGAVTLALCIPWTVANVGHLVVAWFRVTGART